MYTCTMLRSVISYQVYIYTHIPIIVSKLRNHVIFVIFSYSYVQVTLKCSWLQFVLEL